MYIFWGVKSMYKDEKLTQMLKIYTPEKLLSLSYQAKLVSQASPEYYEWSNACGWGTR